MPVRAATLVPLLAALAATPALASDPGNQRSVFPGTRAAALGGAYVALSDDPSGMFYNPAGLSFAKQNDTSLSVTTVQQRQTTYHNALGKFDFVEKSQTFHPNFAGSSYRLGFLTAGFSYLDLDARNLNLSSRFTDLSTEDSVARDYARTHQESSSLLTGGPSLAIRAGDFSLGLTSYIYRRSSAISIHQLVEFNGGAVRSIDQKLDVENVGMIYVAGAMLRTKSLSFGAAVRMPRPVRDSATLITDDVYVGTGADGNLDVTTRHLEQGTSLHEERMPTTGQVGVAWIPSESFLISSEALYHSALPSRFDGEGVPSLEAIFNASLGTEARLGSLILRLGTFTNYSMYPEIQDGGSTAPPRVDYHGFSGGLGFVAKNYDGAVSYVGQWGNGRANVVEGAATAQDVSAEIRTILLGGRYNF